MVFFLFKVEIKKRFLGGVCFPQGLLSGWPWTFSLSFVIASSVCYIQPATMLLTRRRMATREYYGISVTQSCKWKASLWARSCLLLVEGWFCVCVGFGFVCLFYFCVYLFLFVWWVGFFYSNALWMDSFDNAIPPSGYPQGQQQVVCKESWSRSLSCFFYLWATSCWL